MLRFAGNRLRMQFSTPEQPVCKYQHETKARAYDRDIAGSTAKNIVAVPLLSPWYHCRALE
jgi:hypothetical protein